ncbi:hypothetical protein ACMD2_26794, partial [Ananas comosus]
HASVPVQWRGTLACLDTCTDKGVKILIDPKALMHVVGTKMDFSFMTGSNVQSSQSGAGSRSARVRLDIRPARARLEIK